MAIRFIIIILFLRKSHIGIFAENYKNWHLGSSAKFRWKIFAKSLGTTLFWNSRVGLLKISNLDSVEVNSKRLSRKWSKNGQKIIFLPTYSGSTDFLHLKMNGVINMRLHCIHISNYFHIYFKNCFVTTLTM